MIVALKGHKKMATTGENMVKKTSSEPNIPGEGISSNHALEDNDKYN